MALVKDVTPEQVELYFEKTGIVVSTALIYLGAVVVMLQTP